MSKKLISIFVSLLMLFSLSACNVGGNTKVDKRVKVVVSFNAMREFAYAVGKNKIDIVNMTPNGTEPHDFEPKTKDIEALYNAKVFVYNGLNMESWVDKTLKSISNKNLVVVEASKGANGIKNTDAGEIKEHGAYDPHFWISLKGAEVECRNIKEALIKADSPNKAYYEKNYESFCTKLEKLYKEYAYKFKNVKNKSFVTGHAAFAYLCRDYNLKQESVEDVFAEGEPSTKKLSDLVTYCKKNNVKTIFVEDMVSPKVSSTLAREVGARVKKIYTIESKEDGKDYIEAMSDNLKMIYDSLNE